MFMQSLPFPAVVLYRNVMRRRSSASIPHEKMEKVVVKHSHAHLCFLASLSALVLFLLFYFHFAVLGTNPIDASEQPILFCSESSNAHHVSKNYPFVRALRTVKNKSDPCGGRYIYVHDLPPEFNEAMLRECRSLSIWTNMCKFTSNAGLGPPLENEEGVFSDMGWYSTNQFAVDVVFSNRMKQYECLTRDSSTAAAVFVPFYAGLDIS